MLFNEYRFFKSQSQKLIELQEDYRNYITALRRVFDSQKTDDQVSESIIEEKKKPFIAINREKRYLQKSLFDFLKKKKLQNLFKSSEQFHSEESLDSNLQRKAKQKVSRRAKIRTNVPNKLPFRRKIFNVNSKTKGMFIWPIDQKDFWISSFFGLRKVKKGFSFHYGIDMAAMKGTTVKAAADGRVIEAAYSSGYGNTIVIKHDDKYKTRYAHLNKILVKLGHEVQKGGKIGTVGDTGSVRSSGKNQDPSHLHFEIYVFGKQVNPLYILQ